MLKLFLNKINNFRQIKFVRNVLAVATGVAAAQAISLAFMPFLTRLYGAEAFGALAAFTAIINIITPLATLGYSNAIVMPKTEQGAYAVARLSLISAAIISPVVLLVIALFQEQFARLTNLEAQPNLLYLIPVSLLFIALLSVANQICIRDGLFKEKSGAYVTSTLLMNIGKLGGGYIAATGTTLISFLILSKVINFIMVIIKVPNNSSFNIKQWIGIRGIRSAAVEQKDFLIYRMPQSILNAASLGLPVIVLTNYFGSSAAGQYAITTLLIGAPVMLLGNAVLEVFFPKITIVVRETPSEVFKLLCKSMIFMALVGVLPFGVIALYGDVILPWVLGIEWQRAGVYSQWVALWMLSVLITRPAVAAIPALQLQGFLLCYEVVITVLRVGSIALGALLQDDLKAIMLFSLVNIVGYLVLMNVVLIKSKGKI